MRCSAARGCRSGCRSAATSARCWRRSPATPRRSSPATGCGGPATTTRRSRALTELQEHLGLPEAPLRIECYDMAHLQGTDYVGSMVVLEDGLPNKREYRRFKVHVPGNDDYAAMEEVLTRRLTAYLAEQRPAAWPRRAAGQVRLPAAAARRRRRQGPARRRRAGRAASSAWRTRSRSPGLAKRFEEVFVPGPVRPGGDPAGERGAVHAAAHPRRGPPLRQHVPRRAAQQADDDERARRHPRARRDPPQAAGQGARRRQRGQARRRSTTSALPWLPDAVADAVHAKFHPSVSAPSVPEPRPALGRDDGTIRWEHHAEWWIEGFTEGADPSTSSRSCRWPPRSWPAAGGCSTSAAATARSPGWRPGSTAREVAVGIDPTWNQIGRGRRAGRRDRVRAGRRRRPAVRRRARSTPSWPASSSSTSTPSTRRSPRSPGCCAPGGRFCFFLNHPLLQTPDSGWIDDQVLDPPEQYWRIGPYLPEAVTIEEVELGVHIRFVHRPLSRYVNALADHGLLLERMVEPAPPPGFLALAAEYADAATVPAPALRSCERPKPTARLASAAVAEIVLITGHVRSRAVGRGRRARGPRLVRRRQPAASLVEKIVELASVPGSGIERLALVAGPATTAPCSTPSPRLRGARAPRHACCSSTPTTPSSSGATTPPAGGTRSTPRPTACVESIELERAAARPHA